MSLDAIYVRSCAVPSDLPPVTLPEIVVAGRSNCGKSSLINALTGRTRLARTSSAPGRTREILFFEVELAGAPRFHLVDLPGYGYARTSKTRIEAWARLVNLYLSTREGIRRLLLLSDIRRELSSKETDLLEWMRERGVPTLLLLTKSDKLGKSQALAAGERARRLLDLRKPPPLFSIFDPESVAHLRDLVAQAVTKGVES
jgi:GTP-binding protein